LALQGYSLVERIGIENDFALVGGGALDSGLVAALEELTGHGITIPPDPQLTAALGAALIARELAQP
ncbi:MAG TPA: BadF/BadG/BcrA/BcrD ATPase family protein, partial [Thermodesulfobacteriota bacterium]|nr:BadF/BadG/BcrA/BcrD ATPase family protein [Thermodesulfobacteriota bacterium]